MSCILIPKTKKEQVFLLCPPNNLTYTNSKCMHLIAIWWTKDLLEYYIRFSFTVGEEVKNSNVLFFLLLPWRILLTLWRIPSSSFRRLKSDTSFSRKIFLIFLHKLRKLLTGFRFICLREFPVRFRRFRIWIIQDFYMTHPSSNRTIIVIILQRCASIWNR